VAGLPRYRGERCCLSVRAEDDAVLQGYGYVVVEAGPWQAAQWRARDGFDEPLPDSILPAERSWLLTTMWDDDWTCIGGTEQLIDDILRHPVLGERARRVTIDEDSTPPGHTAI
jgi:hypothetical protein